MAAKRKAVSVLFIFPNMNSGLAWSPAIQILSAVLKKEGYRTFSIHIHEEHGVPFHPEDIIRRIKAINPNIIAVTATSFEYQLMNGLAGEIKKHGIAAFLILGGMQATLQPGVFKESHFDAFCVGEGEKPLLALVHALHHALDYTRIPSLWVKKDGILITNPIDTVVTDLNALPFFDWEILDTEKILQHRNGWLSISFSRGCPYKCSFCVNHVLREIKGTKRYCRRRSPENAVAELAFLARSFHINVFNLDDDLLVLDKKWLSRFTTLYRNEIYEHYKIEYKIEARADTLDLDVVTLLKNSGCREVQIGVETGDEFLRNDVLNKCISDEQIKQTVKLIKDNGMKVLVFIMVGVPGETMESLTKTAKLIAALKPYLVRPTFFVPIPYTPLYQYCVEHDLLRKESIVRDHFSDSALALRTVPENALLAFKYLLPWHINRELGLSRYHYAISAFADQTYKQLLNKLEEVTMLDRSLSTQHTECEHYSYFANNMKYLVLHSPERREDHRDSRDERRGIKDANAML